LTSELGRYEGQIDSVVSDFMQVWIKFETLLPVEVARIEEPLAGMSPYEASYRDRDYELFFRVSSILADKTNMTMGEMSAALAVPLSKATRSADWLVAHEYVKRAADPSDRRIVRVSLTPRGLALHRAIKTNIRERVEELLGALTVEERENLFSLIGKVVSSLAYTREK
jgi:DNA-binding MarR family transcriptional regulator